MKPTKPPLTIADIFNEPKTQDVWFSGHQFKLPIGMTARAFIRYMKDRGLLDREVDYQLTAYRNVILDDDEAVRGYREFGATAILNNCENCGAQLKSKDCRAHCPSCGMTPE